MGLSDRLHCDSTGKIYEVFTQFGGIGSKNAEHIEVKDITSDGELTEVDYKDAKTDDEHIEINNITAGALYGGLYSIDIPRIVNALNIEDENGDFGTTAQFIFDEHLVAVDVCRPSIIHFQSLIPKVCHFHQHRQRWVRMVRP